MPTALMPELARDLGISPQVHEDDFIWRFLRSHPDFPTPDAADSHYLRDGGASATKLASLVARHQRPSEGRSPSMLEFASGYGCVTRHLPGALGEWSVTSCDIHPEAVQFIEQELQVPAVLSREVPEDLSLGTFDVVFALSFFSHMPRRTWGPWLQRLFSFVEPGGILAFTTHGSVSWKLFGEPELSDDGFHFTPSSEQHDLGTASYGTTFTTPEFVVAEIYRRLCAPIAELRTGYWWAHQDLWVVSKRS